MHLVGVRDTKYYSSAGGKDELSVLHGLLIGMLSLLFPKHVVTLDLDSIMIVIEQWLEEGLTICNTEPLKLAHFGKYLARSYLENDVKGKG